MRAAIVSHYNTRPIERALKFHGFEISKNPDFVFTLGGDGTILQAENMYPGVPLVPVSKSNVCAHCSVYSVSDLDHVLHDIKSGNYRIKEERKIEAVFAAKTIRALNEIQVHVADPRRAVRFLLESGKTKYNEVISDGLVAATPFGSTAYYRTIGYEPFKSGFRIGMNNAWPRLPPLDLKEKAVVRITREKAWLLADNFYKEEMKKGDSVVIKPSKRVAKFVVF